MQLTSINVGRPRIVEWGGRAFTTAIFKTPTAGPVAIEPDNLAGDEQADLTVHGGPDKAVYAYDAAHYAAWRALLPARTDWTPGLFGENLTTEGLPETGVRVGDLFRVGTARLRAVQPRQPCFKLNARFDDPHMAARFAREGRTGIYFRVEAAGTVQAGDTIELLEAAATAITIHEVGQVILTRTASPDLLAKLLSLPYLPASLKRQFGGYA
ncbi:MOSC domain-containing protein [Hymenobacter sp. UYCo722]|uniref:MOSC domain-containing protein n=1 Tax=Hymenobacter sp. UYCo722 TaxID=3156335 RepID=UPI003393E291